MTLVKKTFKKLSLVNTRKYPLRGHCLAPLGRQEDNVEKWSGAIFVIKFWSVTKTQIDEMTDENRDGTSDIGDYVNSILDIKNMHQLWQAVNLKPFKLEEFMLGFGKIPIFNVLVPAGQVFQIPENPLKWP